MKIWQVPQGRTSQRERRDFRKQGIIIDVVN